MLATAPQLINKCCTDGDGTPETITTFTYQTISTQDNRSPEAINDSASTTVGTTVTINALSNDSDPDGDSLSITALNGQAIASGQTVSTTNGSVTLQPDGQLSFAPNAGFLGNEVFAYQVNDGNGGEDSAQVQVTVNATMDPGTARIGNRVFLDENGNGALDGNESGVNGVRVILSGAGADGQFGTGDDITRIQDINNDAGYYGFDGLNAGQYQVSFSNLPEGATFTTQNAGNDEHLDSDVDVNTGMTEVIDLAAGEQLNSIDAGIVEIGINQAPEAVNDSASATIGQPVIINALGNDSDPDGDPLSITAVNGQTIAPGQTISLSTGQVTSQANFFQPRSVTLQADGQLSFFPVDLGNEVFSYNVSDGRGGEDTAQVQVAVGFPPQGFIGNRVFLDANRNGVLDNDESGVSGVVITLVGAGQDGTFDTSDDFIRIQDINNEGGFYGFLGLNAGQYKVTFSNLPEGARFTTRNAGNDEKLDSDVDVSTGMTDVFDLADGERLDSIDAGVVLDGGPVDPGTARIGNRVFLDENGNGLLDGNESGVNAVRVTLEGAGADGQFGTSDDLTRIQDINNDAGYYGFDDLDAGQYKVSFSNLPEGATFTTQNAGNDEHLDSDVDVNTGMTEVIDLAAGEQLNSIDAGVVSIQDGGKTEIFGTENADWPLKGSEGDDLILGLGGNDQLEGFNGNDHLVSGQGNDHLLGGNGNDTLVGTDNVALGEGEVDTLTGGDGQDRFILSNNDTSYYFGDEWGDFAIIKDFTLGEDVVVLHGPAEQYALEVDQGQGLTRVYSVGDGADKTRDAIAVFTSNTDLNLASSGFECIS